MFKTAILAAAAIVAIAGPAAAKLNPNATNAPAAYGTNTPGSGCIDGPAVVGIELAR